MSRTPQERAALRVLGNAIYGIVLECERYADAHEILYDRKIANDGVLTDGLEQILRGARILLNGELGLHDGGTLDRMILDVAARAGFDVHSGNW